MLKKVICLIVVCFIVTGCSDKDEILNSSSQEISSTMSSDITKNPNIDPEILSSDFLLEPTPLDVQNEMNYDKIIVSLDKQEYSLENENVVCSITNQNVGAGFYYYYIPFVEYYNNNEWVRLSYYPPETEFDGQWYFCAIDGYENIEFSTAVKFEPEYVREELSKGKYRLVLFVGPNKYYAEFEFK